MYVYTFGSLPKLVGKSDSMIVGYSAAVERAYAREGRHEAREEEVEMRPNREDRSAGGVDQGGRIAAPWRSPSRRRALCQAGAGLRHPW